MAEFRSSWMLCNEESLAPDVEDGVAVVAGTLVAGADLVAATPLAHPANAPPASTSATIAIVIRAPPPRIT